MPIYFVEFDEQREKVNLALEKTISEIIEIGENIHILRYSTFQEKNQMLLQNYLQARKGCVKRIAELTLEYAYNQRNDAQMSRYVLLALELDPNASIARKTSVIDENSEYIQEKHPVIMKNFLRLMEFANSLINKYKLNAK